MSDTASTGKLVYEGARFRVQELSLQRRDGGTQQRQIVVPADAVIILPLLDPRIVVMIRNRRFVLGQTLWELPAGTIDPGESPDGCAERELTEETGYAADKLTRLIEFYPAPGYSTEKMTAYTAEGLTFRGQDLDETERITVEALPFEKTMQMIRDNTIRDAKTIAVLLYYRNFQQA